jgi:hypothetical protein
MSATPIKSGKAYRVRGHGLDVVVIAAHPCDAICVALRNLEKKG